MKVIYDEVEINQLNSISALTCSLALSLKAFKSYPPSSTETTLPWVNSLVAFKVLFVWKVWRHFIHLWIQFWTWFQCYLLTGDLRSELGMRLHLLYWLLLLLSGYIWFTVLTEAIVHVVFTFTFTILRNNGNISLQVSQSEKGKEDTYIDAKDQDDLKLRGRRCPAGLGPLHLDWVLEAHINWIHFNPGVQGGWKQKIITAPWKGKFFGFQGLFRHGDRGGGAGAVSYTHLTLPTKA